MNWKDKKQVAKYHRKWRKKNPTKSRGYVRKYREANKEKVSKKSVEWHRQNPWHSKYYAIKYRCENPKNDHYKYYGAKGIKNLITKNQIKRLWFRDKASLMKKPSIDRKNSNGHYEYSNCRFIELSLNSSLAWTGRKHTEETKNKISEKAKGRILECSRGKNHWNYKHGRYAVK